MREGDGSSAGGWRSAVTATDAELDRRAVVIARAAVTAALGRLNFALGAVETPDIRLGLEAARDTLDAVLHDHIDPAVHAVERRQADTVAGGWERDRRRALAWHHGRVL